MRAMHAHYDGKNVCFDEPFFVPQNTPLVVVVLEKDDNENEQWYQLSLRGLENSFDDDEPDYSSILLRESNPFYKP